MAELDIKFPTEKSLADLFNGINKLLEKFVKAKGNKEVSTQVICGSAFNVMLGFPFGWMSQSGTEEAFLSFINDQAKHFVLMNQMRKEKENG